MKRPTHAPYETAAQHAHSREAMRGLVEGAFGMDLHDMLAASLRRAVESTPGSVGASVTVTRNLFNAKPNRRLE